MTRTEAKIEYFNWLSGLVCGKRHSKQVAYSKLLEFLHNTDFRYLIPKDQNRAEDGIDLRYRFSLMFPREDPDMILQYLESPCSVLEMMVALSIRCEENIMDDSALGDRTGQWFWGMIVNLGLGSMNDNRFDEQYASYVVDRFLDRNYDPDGSGGLFNIRHCDRDLRNVEIWYQLCWYLDSIM